MYKIGVIGDKASVSGFKAVGLSVFPCADSAEARKTLSRLTKEEDYAIIYITEGLCRDIADELDKHRDKMLPAIIPIPGMDGSYGIGMTGVKKSVERAVGADILFGND
ncbi:V-type ATP synthase subunit F [Bacilliculturomica massiliensis]|uniref:V-type ATP synthase subunit F n=1 Tax=Bacilliculturomica massiliensis TaxID=1917867 RepID=UPI00102F4DFE|nr:V-type ATP synthase subunit F [Bacilliculturomica massiliensis]